VHLAWARTSTAARAGANTNAATPLANAVRRVISIFLSPQKTCSILNNIYRLSAKSQRRGTQESNFN
jgi:hypothetical protein